jgi:hypothetical protein
MSEKSSGFLFAHSLIDGSGLHICRPSRDGARGAEQQHFYSGKEGYHVVRILGLFSLTGLIIRLFGSYPGSAADETIYRTEDVEEQVGRLHDFAVEQHGLKCRPKIVADSGFCASENVVTPFSFDPNAPVFSAENVFNTVLSRCRIPNEWGFGRVVNLFQTLEFVRALKSDWTEPEKQYVVGCFFSNFVTVFEGSQASSYFSVPLPSFAELIEHIKRSQL